MSIVAMTRPPERHRRRRRKVDDFLDPERGRERGLKTYSLDAPEVECIGKGNAHRPYKFSVKVSVATTLSYAKGGQFVTHVKALAGNTIERLLVDKGYRGHNAPADHKFRVFISGQKQRRNAVVGPESAPTFKAASR